MISSSPMPSVAWVTLPSSSARRDSSTAPKRGLAELDHLRRRIAQTNIGMTARTYVGIAFLI